MLINFFINIMVYQIRVPVLGARVACTERAILIDLHLITTQVLPRNSAYFKQYRGKKDYLLVNSKIKLRFTISYIPGPIARVSDSKNGILTNTAR